MTMDLKLALNAISDVINNRPQPLREFDQIYMKTGDMVVHSEMIARKFQDTRLVFVGDGDAIGLSVAHLQNEGVLQYGPKAITVLDFDERMVNSVNRFAADYEIADRINGILYNVIDPLPSELLGAFDAFHTNPPWGQFNDGESVLVFLERAVQATRVPGRGVVVIADDANLQWTNLVLRRTQQHALSLGLILGQMVPELHSYHLDDAPELKSCAMVFRKIGDDQLANIRLAGDRLANFYGRGSVPRVQYVRDVPEVARGQAPKESYRLEVLPD